MTQFILGDLENLEEEDMEIDFDERLPEDVSDNRALTWTRYRDPASKRVFWVVQDESSFFFEDIAEWTEYQTSESKRWWCNNADTSFWFFSDTGTMQ